MCSLADPLITIKEQDTPFACKGPSPNKDAEQGWERRCSEGGHRKATGQQGALLAKLRVTEEAMSEHLLNLLRGFLLILWKGIEKQDHSTSFRDRRVHTASMRFDPPTISQIPWHLATVIAAL